MENVLKVFINNLVIINYYYFLFYYIKYFNKSIKSLDLILIFKICIH